MKIVGQMVFVCQSVSQSVCMSKHFGEERPNGWSDRDGGGTGRRPDPPERRWCRSGVDRQHVARGTCRPEKACKKTLTHLQVKRRALPMSNSQVTSIPPQLKIRWGCRSSWGAGCTRQRRQSFFDMGSSGESKF